MAKNKPYQRTGKPKISKIVGSGLQEIDAISMNVWFRRSKLMEILRFNELLF
jgi:hypothetical protein